MLELEPGRGITLFRGRPLHRIPHPPREVGALLGDVPGHPGRTVRGHLRMLCAAAGLPATRADDVLEDLGLGDLRGEVLGSLSRGLDRRLGMACALLADPHTLVLDAPTTDLAPRDARWLHGLLGAYARHGGTVLFTTADPKEAAGAADHVVTVDGGRVVADQEAAAFARTRLRPRVAVRSPQAARLGLLLSKEARNAQRPIEVVQEDGNRLSVYGTDCAHVGEAAFRHGILVHQLADETADMGAPPHRTAPGPPATAAVPAPVTAVTEPPPGASDHTPSASGNTPTASEDTPAPPVVEPPAPESLPRTTHVPASPASAGPPPVASPPLSVSASEHGALPRLPAVPSSATPPANRSQGLQAAPFASSLPPPVTVRPVPVPLCPLRYEVYRVTGVRAGYATIAGVLLLSAVLSVLLGRAGGVPQSHLLTAWPRELPLPPVALGAGLLGALAFGEEYRYPALAADRGTVPRRLGLLGAKLLVAAVTAALLAGATAGCDAALLHLVHGPRAAELPDDWSGAAVSWLCLVVGCAWAGVLAAGVFRSTSAGLAAVLAVPLVIVPVVRWVLAGPVVPGAAGPPGRFGEFAAGTGRSEAGDGASAVVQMIVQPVGSGLVLSLIVLFCAFLLTRFRGRVR